MHEIWGTGLEETLHSQQTGTKKKWEKENLGKDPGSHPLNPLWSYLLMNHMKQCIKYHLVEMSSIIVAQCDCTFENIENSISIVQHVTFVYLL